MKKFLIGGLGWSLTAVLFVAANASAGVVFTCTPQQQHQKKLGYLVDEFVIEESSGQMPSMLTIRARATPTSPPETQMVDLLYFHYVVEDVKIHYTGRTENGSRRIELEQSRSAEDAPFTGWIVLEQDAAFAVSCR